MSTNATCHQMEECVTVPQVLSLTRIIPAAVLVSDKWQCRMFCHRAVALMASVISNIKVFVLVDGSGSHYNKEGHSPHRKPGQYEVLSWRNLQGAQGKKSGSFE